MQGVGAMQESGAVQESDVAQESGAVQGKQGFGATIQPGNEGIS